MTLPTFLGIGAIRAGTTWLHELLASHPDVYVPTRRKEIYFFDLYFDRGLSWYERFFPNESEAASYRAIGEVTPTYLYPAECAGRIASLPSIDRLILMLRNPVDALYSLYGMRLRSGNVKGSFETFLSESPRVLRLGRYSQFVRQYLQFFSRDQILALVLEDAVSDLNQTKYAVASFLDVAAYRFPQGAGTTRANRSYVPNIRSLHALATWLVGILYRHDMDWVVRIAVRLGVERLMGGGRPLPSLNQEARQYLRDLYAEEIDELQSLLGLDLARWKLPSK